MTILSYSGSLFTVLGIIYVPMGVAGYYALGSHASPNVVISLSPGPVRITIEIMLLLHLVAAFPIIINPPCQYFEQLLKIPHGKYYFY